MGARKGALFVAEQLRLDEALGQRGAAHLDERTLRAQRVVMNGLRDQLLAGARLTADEHRRIRARHLRHLLVHQPHRAAGPEDVGKVVALPQLALEVRVFLAQPLALGIDHALNANRLSHQRGDDAKELHRAVEVTIGLETEVRAQRADRLPIQQNGHTDVADLLARQLRPLGGSPQEHRLARYPRDHNRLAALHHSARDPFTEPECRVCFPARRTFGGDDFYVAVGGQQCDGAANDAVMPIEDAKHLMERALLVRTRRQCLTDFEQRRQSSKLARAAACRRFRQFQPR